MDLGGAVNNFPFPLGEHRIFWGKTGFLILRNGQGMIDCKDTMTPGDLYKYSGDYKNRIGFIIKDPSTVKGNCLSLANFEHVNMLIGFDDSLSYQIMMYVGDIKYRLINGNGSFLSYRTYYKFLWRARIIHIPVVKFKWELKQNKAERYTNET